MAKEEFEVRGLDQPVRLDKALKTRFPEWGRSAIKSILNQKKVKVNSKTVWLGSWEVKDGDHIEVSDPPEDKPAGYARFDPAWVIVDQGDLIAELDNALKK